MLDILIADDHSAVRHGLALLTQEALNESCAIDFARSGDEVLERLQQKKYAILLSDLMMPDQKGISLIGEALNILPGLKIVVISMGPESDFAPQCLHSGACAYINKGEPDITFTKVIRSVAYDSSDYHFHTKKIMTKDYKVKDKELKSFNVLSPREHEVVMLLLRGKGIIEIAQALSLSQSAVSTLKGRAFIKLNVQSLIELNRLAYYQGLHPDGAIRS